MTKKIKTPKTQKRYIKRRVWRKGHYRKNPDGSRSLVPGHWTTVGEVVYVGPRELPKTRHIMDPDTGHFKGRTPERKHKD